MSKSVLDTMRERRAAVKQELDALLKTAETENRSLNTEETGKFDQLVAEFRDTGPRIAQLEEMARDEAAAAEARKGTIADGEQRNGVAHVTDAPVYVPDGGTGHSYFKDLALRSEGDRDATDRLVRNSKATADEQRAIGNTNATGGSGGEFAPPTWLVDEWINLLRPGRVTADLFKKNPVPPGTPSISIPKLLTGTAVAVQSTQNTIVAQSDLTTGFVSTGFATIAGKEVVSQQLLDQSAVSMDRVISDDLAAAYNAFFGTQIILGAGTGANNNSVLNGLINAPVLAANQAVLAATPTATTFYSKATGMLASFVTNRFAQPEVWIMHPRRWYWLMSLFDSQGRPLVVPADVAMNPIAVNGSVGVQGAVGQFLGLPVVIDPNIPTNLGVGTNQDTVFLLRTSDLWLYESTPQAESFRAPYAESLGVLFRLFNYAGTIMNRLGSSIATMNGAGLVPPAF